MRTASNYSQLKVLFFIVLDNLTLVKKYKHQTIFSPGNDSDPVEYLNVIYHPKYSDFGEVMRYEASIKNLRIHVYRDRVKLINSIHKFWHGGNWTDFFICEIGEAIAEINHLTGISWEDSSIKKIEWGVNLSLNPDPIIKSLLTFKHKEYHPMVHKGNVYGVKCEFDEYLAKAYDKAYQVQYVDKLKLNELFRWEIGARERYLKRIITGPLTFESLIESDSLRKLADHSISIFKNSIKRSRMNFYKLTATEKKIVACMQNSEIREELKRDHPDTYKRDLKRYREIMSDPEISIKDISERDIIEKFDELLYGVPTCNKLRKGYNILPIAV